MMTAEKYLQILNDSYAVAQSMVGCLIPENKLEFLADDIFDFTTYDPNASAEFAQRAVEVCEAINTITTFEYIKDNQQYKWFLIMCNMPFFKDRIDWGTSIRGAWWDSGRQDKFTLQTHAMFDGENHIENPTFTRDEWFQFITAVVAFARS